MKTATICTIGDEILIGQITDTNSALISRSLNAAGIRVNHMCSIGDERHEIIGRLEKLLLNNDLVITTGGLGPTRDDITKQALATLFGSRGMTVHDEQAAINREILTRRGIALTELNRAQSDVPEGCDVIPNRLGTAPCLVFRFPEHRFPHHPVLYALPGVPYEVEGLLPDLLQDIRTHFRPDPICHKTLLTFGIPESLLAEEIADWEEALPHDMKLAYLPSPTLGVRLRLSIYGCDEEEGYRRIGEAFAQVRKQLGDAVYGEEDETLPTIIGRMLRESGRSLAAAESCTGGQIAASITAVPGASEYFAGSVTSYCNRVKINTLGVPESIIATHGAVSRECVEAMASGVLKLLDTDTAVATSGIAGPGGGSPEKPVGTVWIAAAIRETSGEIRTASREYRFSGDRLRNIERFTAHALNFLRLELLRR